MFIIIDVLVALALCAGVLYQDHQFINMGYFAGWFFGVLNLLAYLTEGSRELMAKEYRHRTRLRRGYGMVTDVAFVIFAAWMGWFLLATVYALQTILKAQFIEKQEGRLREAALVE